VLKGDGSVLPTRPPSRLYARPFAFSMSSLEPDYSPRVLWRLQHKGHQIKAPLMPHAQYVAVVILVTDRRGAQRRLSTRPTRSAGPTEQRLINAAAAR